MLGTKNDEKSKSVKPKEGDLYKVVNVFGKTFELYYGYYEESDRYSKFSEPIEIYPDFLKFPLYTDDGEPFVTAMQSTCEHYVKLKDANDKCYDCLHFKQGEELFGVCVCKHRKNKK